MLMLNKYQAERVKQWRVSNGCSWRKIADKAAEAWPDLGISPGNQIDGQELCSAAAEVLKEDEYSWDSI